MEVYNGYLFIGDYNDVTQATYPMLKMDFVHLATVLSQSVNLYRMDPDYHMELVVGDATKMFPNGGISGLGTGFGHNENQYIWRMQEYGGKLYVGTFDTSSLLEPIGQFSNGDIINMTPEEWATQLDYLRDLIEELLNKKYPDGFPAPTPTERGVVADFFRDSAHRYISIPSASAVPRAVFETVGGFPEGMKIGEDLYMWIKIARRYKVCFSPKPLANYSKVASNRSSAIYTPERTRYSFEELYDPAAADGYNEFVARAALGKALIISAKGGTKDAARAIRFFGYTKTYRRTLHKVRILNALPRSWRGPLIGLYNSLAWRIARKGL